MRHTTLLFLLLAGALSVALFSVKYQVQDLEDELVDLNKTIIDERQSIHVLRAEWSHFNNPERLRVLSERYLDMKPVEPAQMTSFKNVDRFYSESVIAGEINRDLPISTASGESQENP